MFPRWPGKPHGRPGHVTSFDDLRQCGYLALVDAVKGYSEDKGKFLTWFGFFLKTAFAEEAGYRTQHQRRDPLRWSASLDAPIPGAEDLLLSDMVPDPADSIGDVEEAVWREELHTAMTEALCTLPPECRDMLHRLYYQGQTLTAAGRETGRTLEGARQVEKKALRQLRRPQTARKLRPFAYPDGDIYAAGLQQHGNRCIHAHRHKQHRSRRAPDGVGACAVASNDSKQESKKQPAPADDFCEIEDDGDLPF